MGAVIYTPAEGEPDQVCVAFDMEFPAGQAVDVSDENAFAKLSVNPCFTVAPARKGGKAASADDGGL